MKRTNNPSAAAKRVDILNEHPRSRNLLLYFVFFVLSATYFQAGSPILPWVDGSPIESFTKKFTLNVEFHKFAYCRHASK